MAPSEEKAVENFGCDERYDVQQFLGQGSYGTVCSAMDQKTGDMVAIKKMTNVFSHVAETKRTLRELRLLRHFCHHENVLTIHNVLPPQKQDAFSDIFIVTEMMDTDLDQVIRSPQQLSELHVQTFLYQILRGLQYVHAAHVIHRDLKPGNILVNQNCTVKICDFGLARLEPETGYGGFMTEYVVTRWYRAPEIMLSGQDYTQSIDVWSVGCILAEMLGRQPVFPGKNYVDQVRVIVDLLGTPSEAGLMMIEDLEAREYVKSLPVKPQPDWKSRYPQAGEEAADLLDKLLKFDPNERCTVEDALNHPYLGAIRAEDNDVFTPAPPFKFDFENTELSQAECRQLVVEEVEFYEKQDAMIEQMAAQEQLEMVDMIPEGEEIPFGQDSLKFGQFGALQQAEEEQYEDDFEPQPPHEAPKYNTMAMNMQRVMMGEVEETGWGTKALTPVCEERDEELQRQKQEDEVLVAAERAAERAAANEAARRQKAAAAEQERLVAEQQRIAAEQQKRLAARHRDLSQSAGTRASEMESNGEVGLPSRRPRGGAYGGAENRPVGAGAAVGRRAVSAGTSRGPRDPSPSGARGRRDPSPSVVRGRLNSAGAENRRSGSASRTRKSSTAGAPPPMPRKDPLPAAAKGQTYSRAVYQAGRQGAGNAAARASKSRPSSAPNNSKVRQGVTSATTASSLQKRRQSQPGGGEAEDAGKAALQDLLSTYKSKAERELSGGTRKPLKARFM